MVGIKNNRVKLSIIIPAFNTEKYIDESIESIVKQNMSRCELVIVDDGSTDSTPEKCDMFARKYKNVSVIHTTNRGVSSARNTGIAKAKGELIWFIDSDDRLEPQAIKTVEDNFKKEYDLLAFGINEFNKKKSQVRIYKPGVIDRETATNRIIADDDLRGYLFNKVFRLDIIKKNNIKFDEKIKTCEDLLFCIEYLKHSKKNCVLKDVLYCYRQRKGGAIHNSLNMNQATALDAFLKIEEKCESNSSKTKSRALLVKAFYKYRSLLGSKQKKYYRGFVRKFKQDSKSFEKKDKILIMGYRHFGVIMKLLHYKQSFGASLFDSETDDLTKKQRALKLANKYAPFVIFLSFYLGMIHFSLVTPIIVAGFLAFVLNILNKYSMRREGLTKVELVYFCFVVVAAAMCVFSYSVTESIKQIIKIITLVFVFWQIIVFLRNANMENVRNSFSRASILFFIITAIMYVAGLISLGFYYHVDNVDVLGVTIDRHMPRLISLAYNDPNITALYLSVPLVYFLSRRKTKAERIGLAISFVLIGLTVSRGALLSLAPTLLFYLIFSKEKIIVRIVTLIKMAACLLLPLLALVIATSSHASVATNTTAVDLPGESTQVVPSSGKKNGPVGKQEDSNNPIAKHFDFQSGGGSGRLSLWRRGIEIIEKNPLTGIGLNNTYVYTEAEYHEGKYIHNTYIEIFMEEGLIGGAIYIAVIVEICAACWRLKRISLFPAMYFISLLCAQMFLSLDYSEVFFAGLMVIVLYSVSVEKNYIGICYGKQES